VWHPKRLAERTLYGEENDGSHPFTPARWPIQPTPHGGLSLHIQTAPRGQHQSRQVALIGLGQSALFDNAVGSRDVRV
jgi:hypothetical protein